MKFEKFTVVGDSKELLIKTLDFIMSTNKIKVKGFFIEEKNGYLVFCSYTNDKDTTYPFEQTSVSLTEHIYQYIDSLSEEQLAAMGCEPNGYEEEYSIGWELFIPDWYSDDHCIDNYTWGKTVLAVKPSFIEYGK